MVKTAAEDRAHAANDWADYVHTGPDTLAGPEVEPVLVVKGVKNVKGRGPWNMFEWDKDP